MSRQTDFAEIKRLKARNRTLKQEANLWHKRVDEAAEAVKDYEDVQAENKRLKAALIWSEKFDGNILVKDMREFLQALKGVKDGPEIHSAD